MKSGLSLVIAPALGLVLSATAARADGPCTPAVAATWGTGGSSGLSYPVPETPVMRARDMLARAKILEESAATDEKAAVDLTTRLPALRASAKTARERADRALTAERQTLVARAEELEADVVVSEVEIVARKRTAADSRQVAANLRARAVQVVRETPSDPAAIAASSPCDPPFRFTADGRKIYRIECFR